MQYKLYFLAYNIYKYYFQFNNINMSTGKIFPVLIDTKWLLQYNIYEVKTMIQRDVYLKKLIDFKDKDLIKIITGIRRCGKSTLFDIYINYLKEQGIQDEQIIKINLESQDFNFENYKELYNYIKGKIVSNKKNYVFIDEVQSIEEFQKAIDSLYINKNIDLYITRF